VSKVTIKANLVVIREEGDVFISRESLLKLFCEAADATENNCTAILGIITHAILGAEEGGRAITEFSVPVSPSVPPVEPVAKKSGRKS
jgi:hypothetical protein